MNPTAGYKYHWRFFYLDNAPISPSLISVLYLYYMVLLWSLSVELFESIHGVSCTSVRSGEQRSTIWCFVHRDVSYSVLSYWTSFELMAFKMNAVVRHLRQWRHLDVHVLLLWEK